MSSRDPKPEVLRLEELALMVKAGDIKLPQFQRPFVWKRSDMLLLLDSIYRGYPIGSLLLWNSSQRLKSVRDIADLVVDASDAVYPTSYLLDGQQRLTTLCGALFWAGGSSDSIWNIWFDLEHESFIHGKGVNTELAIPLNKLIDTGDFIGQCMRFQHLSERDAYISRAQKLLRSIKDYKIAVVKIGDMTIEEVAPIFERINSTGRKLTMVDLMMAATWSNGFDLSAEIRKIQRACDDAGLSGVSGQFILRSIAASAGFGVNKEDIQQLRTLSPDHLRQSAEDCREAFAKASSWITEVLPVQDASFLPYGLFLTHCVELFRVAGELPLSKLQELEAWFWFTSATSYFAGASTGQNSKDVANVRAFAEGRVGRLFDRGEIDITGLLFDRFNLRNASSTTIALILLTSRPDASISGRSINIDSVIEKSGRLYNKVEGAGLPDKNVCMIINPYRESVSDALHDEDLLDSHFLSAEIVKSVALGMHVDFMELRARRFSRFVEAKTGCKCNYSHVLDGFDDALSFPDASEEEEKDIRF